LSEPDRTITLSARLRRLPLNVLLALVNATSILAIAAAILVLVAIVRIDNFAGRVVTTMTEAVLSKADLPSKDVLANLRGLREEIRTVGTTLRDIKLGENPVLRAEVTQLREVLTTLNESVDRLTDSRTILTDEAIARLGQEVSNTLIKMKGCAPKVGQTRSSDRYAVFTHKDHISTIRRAINTVWNHWLPASRLKAADAPNFERYDGNFDPLTGNGGLEIWIPVRE
jgi:hypothetical protein